MFGKEFTYSDTNEKVQPGDKVIIEFEVPKDFKFIGRADKVLQKLIEDNNGKIKKSES